MSFDMIPRYQQYSEMCTRLPTFRSWPVSFLHPHDLASAGMFYTGMGQKVICYVCGNSLEAWEPGDDPLQMHAMLYPECSLSQNSSSDKSKTNALDDYYKQFFNEADRLKTFYDWTCEQTSKEDLAKNGFISQHNGDSIQCVFCRVCISNWAHRDNISEMHRKLSSVCPLANGNETRNIPLPSPNETFVTNAKQDSDSSKPAETEEKLCKVCYDKPADMVLLPCGHLFSCKTCAHILDKCCICRKRITGRIQAWF